MMKREATPALQVTVSLLAPPGLWPCLIVRLD